MNHCPHTTQRMTDFIFAHRMRRLVISLAALAPSLRNASSADVVSLDDVAENLRKATYAMRRAAKEMRAPERRELSSIGSFDRVDWTQVAHAVMYSLDPVYASDHDRHVAEVAAMN